LSNGTSDGMTSGNGGGREEFSLSKSKKQWSRLQGGDPKLRSDDEAELTNEITGHASMRTKGSHEEMHAYPLSDIHVKKDVSWSSKAI
jgi:hypothetical protein